MAIKVKRTKVVKDVNENNINNSEVKQNKKGEKDKKVKKEKKVLERKPFALRVTYAAELCLEQRYTDEKIVDMVNKKFEDYDGKKYDQKEMGRTRWMLRNGKIKDVEIDGKKFGRLYEVDGKIYTKEELPKKTRAKKVKKEDDLLNNIANINVHDKEQEQEQEQDKSGVKKTKKVKETKKTKVKKTKK